MRILLAGGLGFAEGFGLGLLDPTGLSTLIKLTALAAAISNVAGQVLANAFNERPVYCLDVGNLLGSVAGSVAGVYTGNLFGALGASTEIGAGFPVLNSLFEGLATLTPSTTGGVLGSALGEASGANATIGQVCGCR